jgi:hypothetical protein
MRYCPHCRRLNPGHPVICHYCGRTWYVRLCPRHHENPANAQYCGQCGSADLTETAGRRPWWPYFVKILILGFLCLVFFFTLKGFFSSFKVEALSQIMRFVLALIFLTAGYMIVLSVLPQPIRNIFTKINRFFLKGISKALLWFGRRIKEFTNLILNW